MIVFFVFNLAVTFITISIFNRFAFIFLSLFAFTLTSSPCGSSTNNPARTRRRSKKASSRAASASPAASSRRPTPRPPEGRMLQINGGKRRHCALWKMGRFSPRSTVLRKTVFFFCKNRYTRHKVHKKINIDTHGLPLLDFNLAVLNT